MLFVQTYALSNRVSFLQYSVLPSLFKILVCLGHTALLSTLPMVQTLTASCLPKFPAADTDSAMPLQRLTVGKGLLVASQLFYSIVSFIAGKSRLILKWKICDHFRLDHAPPCSCLLLRR